MSDKLQFAVVVGNRPAGESDKLKSLSDIVPIP